MSTAFTKAILEFLLVNIFLSRIGKHLSSKRSLRWRPDALTDGHASSQGVCPIRPEGTETPRVHLFKAHDQNTISGPIGDRVLGHRQAGRSRGAIVILVIDGDSSHAKLVEDSLTAGTIAVAIACHPHVHVIVVDMSIQHGLDASLVPKFGVIDFASRLEEFGQPNPQHISRHSRSFGSHGSCWSRRDWNYLREGLRGCLKSQRKGIYSLRFGLCCRYRLAPIYHHLSRTTWSKGTSAAADESRPMAVRTWSSHEGPRSKWV